jgi:NO-binding membrane sensor protein with MHYT domain
MHFIGMTAYRLGDMSIAYNVPLTALSLVVAVAVSALGISIVCADPRSNVRLVGSGTVTGLGIAAMHYLGMAAMRTGSKMTYDRARVVLSVGLAIGAALAALFIAVRVRTRAHITLASILMTGAVCGMHYTAMTAVRVEHADMNMAISGANPILLVFAVCTVTSTVLTSVIILALGDDPRDRATRAPREVVLSRPRAATRTGRPPERPAPMVPSVVSPGPIGRELDPDATLPNLRTIPRRHN